MYFFYNLYIFLNNILFKLGAKHFIIWWRLLIYQILPNVSFISSLDVII